MSGHPSAADLIDSVRGFLAELEPELSGRQAFHAKVAGNVLALIERELRQQPEAVEAAALAGLLGREAPLGELRAEACAELRDGDLDAQTPGLLDALTAATLARLAADNPKFSTYRRMTEPKP
jgi:Domain of unknown function (DUF6285)